MRLLLTLFLVSLAAGAVFAADALQPDKSKGAAIAQNPAVPEKSAQADKRKALKEMTPSELSAALEALLDHSPGAIDFISGLKKEGVAGQKGMYTYKGVPLEKLEKNKLIALYNRVNQERARLNAERLAKQMESIQRAQKAVEAANQASRSAVTAPNIRPPQPPPAAPALPQIQAGASLPASSQIQAGASLPALPQTQAGASLPALPQIQAGASLPAAPPRVAEPPKTPPQPPTPKR